MRAAVLARAGLQIAGEELVSRAKSQVREIAQTKQIEIFVAALSQLKGSAMKVGQILALEAQDYLPPQALDALAKLQSQASPIDSAPLFELARNQLGDERFESLGLHSEPLASASIGQVYRGNSRQLGEVAVKIQFPNVNETVQSDVQILKKLVQMSALALGKQIDFERIAEEVQTVFLHETDYHREAEMMRLYKLNLTQDARFVVSTPYPEFSSPKVLTMSFEPGMGLRDWILTNPSRELKDWLAITLLDLFILEFYKFGLVQTDPNLGNFLIRPDEKKLVLLDCGATLTYSREFRESYKELVRVIASGDREKILKCCFDRGFLDPREKPEVLDLFIHMVLSILEPFEADRQPFDYSDRAYLARVRTLVWNFSKATQFTGPPRELIFLHRKLGGIYQILKMLEVRLDLREFWQKALNGH